MKVSIITTVYKAEKDLPRLLESMMAQKSPELEFFLIDNGSPDRCGEICREYAKKDSRFTVYTIKENVGYIRARNIGIKECSGDYIGFCDSDDYLEPEAYDKAIEKIKETKSDLYITAYRTIFSNHIQENRISYEKGLYVGEEIREKLLPQAFGPVDGREQLHGFAWKQIFRRNLILENQFAFMVELQPYEDQLFNIDVIKKCDKVYVDDNCIYNYIVNEQSITAKLLTNFDAEAEWKRILLLYSEKKNRVESEKQMEACCNQLLMFVYSMILNMAKQQKMMTKELAMKFSEVIDCEILINAISNSGQIVGRSIVFIKKCLMNQQYSMMFSVIRLALKLRG